MPVLGGVKNSIIAQTTDPIITAGATMPCVRTTCWWIIEKLGLLSKEIKNNADPIRATIAAPMSQFGFFHLSLFLVFLTLVVTIYDYNA